MKSYVLHLCAKNDSNGNPRRLWIKIDIKTGETVLIADEGYRGQPDEMVGSRIYYGLTIEITPAEYRARVAWAKKQGIYLPS